MKKNLLNISLLVFVFGLLSVPMAAQNTANSDSLEGFDEAAVMEEIKRKGIPETDVAGYLRFKKSEFVGKKYGTWQVPIHTHNHDHHDHASGKYSASPQMTPCTNMDFESGNLTGWTGSTGSNPGCCTAPGLVAGQHTIVGPGPDPIIGAPLSMVAPGGGSWSVRLGNSNTGAQAERLEQTFTVSPSTTSFTYQYAVVLEDPNHSPTEQPFFSIEMYDQANQLIPCSQYFVQAAANIPGFQPGPSFGVIWKDWTTVNVNLANYVGQNVRIVFTTGDCTQGGHYGYAYIDGSCLQLAITASDTLCQGDAITVSAPPGSASYAWSPGGETTQSIQVTQQGNYCVTMTSVQGCQEQLCIYVQEFPKPTAAFNINSPSCSLWAGFTDSTYNASVATWQWDFGDNSTSTQQSPQHTYAQGGLYNVELIVTTANGCSDTLVQQLSPGGVPIAGFDETMICLNGSFTDTTIVTQGNATNWQWNFGDPASAAANTSVFQNPTHNFTSAGVYNVTLIVTSSNNCTDTLVQPVNVVTNLNADFSNTSACEGNTTSFTDLSVSGAGTISSWSWNFGDATFSSIQNPTHQYSTPGTYSVTLTASTSTGCVGTITQNVTVNPVPTPGFLGTNECLSFPTEFTNQSNILTGNIASYSWNFGDAGTSSQQNPQHTYVNPGVYNVTLIVTSDSGCVDTLVQQVNVYPNPVADFVAADVDGCAPHCTDFTDLSTVSPGVITQWLWNFGDSTATSSLQNPNHCFNDPGSYSVTLTVTTNNGCVDSVTFPNYITAYPSPVAGFTADPNPTTVLEPLVYFTDISTGGSQWDWNFGDGDSITYFSQTDPSHTFSGEFAGNYTVTQTVTSPNGCVDVASLEVIVLGDYSFYIPNAFTPNGDGKNEFFFGTGEGIVDYELYVFDRWGNQLFYSDDLYKFWDGKYKGNIVQEDVYVWKVNIMDIFRKKHTYIGHVSVIR